MLSAKSFRPSINTAEQANRWLRIFAADIYSRLVEEGVLENKRRPKTINLHHRSAGQTRSRSAPIPLGKNIDELGLFELARNLLGQLILEGKVWPCANISLSVAGFEEGITGNMGIGSFLVKGDEARAMHASSKEPSTRETGLERPPKRRRTDVPAGIQRFFGKAESTEEQHDDDLGSQDLPGRPLAGGDAGCDGDEQAAISLFHCKASILHEGSSSTVGSPAPQQQPIMSYVCPRCERALDSANGLQSHQDWHFAKDLQDKDRGLSKTPTPTSSKRPAGNSKKKGGQGKSEKGQSKLAFG